MVSAVIKVAIFTQCLLLSLLAHADERVGIEAILEDYRTVFDETLKSADREWVLSTIKKVNGRWRASHSRWLTGPLRRQTFEIERASVDELASKVQTFANEQGWQTAFECHSFSCGRSYAWATEILDNKLLHGADKHQHYWVWRNGEQWLSVYLVERANQKLYLQFTMMTPDNAKQEALLEEWQGQGYAMITPSAQLVKQSFTEERLLRLAVQWLDQQSVKVVAVVGHNQEQGVNTKAQEAKSLNAAETTAKALKELAPNLVVKPYGLGPLAPRQAMTSRVEVVPLEP